MSKKEQEFTALLSKDLHDYITLWPTDTSLRKVGTTWQGDQNPIATNENINNSYKILGINLCNLAKGVVRIVSVIRKTPQLQKVKRTADANGFQEIWKHNIDLNWDRFAGEWDAGYCESPIDNFFTQNQEENTNLKFYYDNQPQPEELRVDWIYIQE